MDESGFSPAANGRLIRGIGGYTAFVPVPLFPGIEWGPDLVRDLSAADQALGRLSGIGHSLSNPHLLIRPFVKREAVLSSKIEGTLASLSDLFYFEAAPSSARAGSDVAEVANYIRAMDFGLSNTQDRPLGLNVLKEMHALLMEGVRGSDKRPGQFRRERNWIGPPSCRLEEASYVPPPPELLSETLDAFEKALHTPTDLPPLVRLAALHYQFEAIHPFMDGNGRIGRLLITLLLCGDGLLPQPLLYLSAFFEKFRDEYYRRLLQVSQSRSWVEWIRFFLRGVSEQALDAIERARRLIELRQRFHHEFQEARSSALLLKLIDELFSTPMITVPRAALMLNVTYRAAQANVERLVAGGILREVTGQRRNRVYVAKRILEIVEKPLTPGARVRATGTD
jgi:Fic family protein